ncbi:metallophosphoesterase [Pyrobaculum islandicum DSM 4184]|uniref:Metallophosphoesterase n=1 Tax=Pyrobaculum islandicum (strain DSM 4184 / JCM 9189 / GEO3) TaxID=384616 RepID=A1RQM5_PYRIL|nr:metallophosphoesterase [Pyrobaculum islandicum]ABL87257.1 metallophosphoesterase [Pyrobaculum islandicum DSM 4184]
MKPLFQILLTVALVFAASITDPRWAVPTYVTPGGVFNITLDAPTVVKSVALAAPGMEKPLELRFNVSGNVITAYVPADAPLGLYDIVINGGEIYEPKAVWVGNVTGPLRIIQLTDIHVGVELDMASVYRLIHGALYASSGPYDVVFLTGDLADVGGQPWQYALLVRYASTITKPIFAIPGNHDHAGDDPLNNYRRYVGPPYWYRVVGPYLIIGLDSGHDGYLTEEQVKFYGDILRRYPDKVKIVLIHHPPFYLRDAYIVETYRGPQDIDRLNRDPTGRRPYYIVYTSYLYNRPTYERFLNLTIRYRVALVMAGHVHSGNSTVVINGTYFVTTRTLGGSIDKSHGFRTYVVYPDGRVQIDPETLTYKNYAVVTWGTKAAQIYIDSDLLPGTIAIDLPGQYQGLKTLNGTAQLVEAKKHPLAKYTRYYISIVGKPVWLAIGDYAPAPAVAIEKIMPRFPTPGDVVTVTIKAEDPNVGIPFLTVDGKKILASYPSEQPVYQYRFKYDKPTTLQIQAPGGQPTTIQIGQATPSPTTPTPTATPTPSPTPSKTPTPTTPTATPTPTPSPTPTPTLTVAPAPAPFPTEAVVLVIIAAVGAALLAALAKTGKKKAETGGTRVYGEK